MTVLVTGATGFIGRALVHRLHELGSSVVVLSRKAAVSLPTGVRLIRGDITQPGSLPQDMFCGVDTIYHCAGEIGDRAVMRRLHVHGTASLLNLAGCETERRSRPLRWIQLSSVGAYGPGDRSGEERFVREDSAEDPRGEYEITKTEADNLLRESSRQGRIALTIVRPSNVFGRDMPNQSLRSLVRAIARGRFFYIGSRGAMCTYIHVDDVVRALLASSDASAAVGKTYNLSNDCTLRDLVNSVADSVGRRRPSRIIPESIVRTLNYFFEGRSFWPLTSSRIDALVSRTSYPSDLISAELGFKCIHPVPASVLELI